MPRALRIFLIAAGSLLGLVVVVFALAWFLMPKEWINREAQRQAGRLSGATVRWKRLSPGLQGFSLGARIEGLYARLPAQGPVRAEASAREVFVSFRLLPLFARRVEISAARVSDGGIALTDRGQPGGGMGKMPSTASGAAMALVLPKVELVRMDVRTRDRLGGGVDFRGLTATAQIDGTVQAPRWIRLDATAESLSWKPSAREPEMRLPGPLRVGLRADSRDSGKRLEITKGEVALGPIVSKVSGEIRTPGAGAQPELDLILAGGPQELKSSDEALKPFTAKSPATWTTRASWEVHVNGSPAAPYQIGRVTLKPLSISAANNSFALDQVDGNWTTAADQTYTASANGGGSGVSVSLTARGSTAPGGASNGEIVVQAPASRLNGLVPNAPTWSAGELECRAVFSVKPPAVPSVRWTVKGKGMSGTVPGVARPVGAMDFNVDGDERVVNVRSFTATVGSTRASLTGTVEQGKPLGTGSFQVTADRIVAEEWAPPKGAAGAAAPAGAPAKPAAPPPIPLRAFDAAVSIGELKSGTMTLRNVTMPVRYAAGAITVEPIHGAIGTGTLAGSLKVMDILTTAPNYAMHLDVKRAPVEELTSGVLPLKLDLAGFASGVIDLAGPGMPGGPATESLRGALTGTIEQGRFRESPTVLGLSKALGLTSGSPGDLVFKTITQSIRIDRGRLLLDKIKGDVGKDLFEMAGWMGLDRSLDVDLLLRLDPSRIQGGTALAAVARYARDKDGRLPVNVRITGTAMAPKFTIKPTKAMQAAGNRLGEQLLKSLTKPAKGDSSASDTTAGKEPVDPTTEALKRLLGK